MKVLWFNEARNYKPTDKILKVSVSDYEVSYKEIEETSAYQRSYQHNLDDGVDKYQARENSILYGLEELIYTSGNANFNYTLVDGLGNPITDEEEFDKLVASGTIDDKNKYELWNT